IQPPIWSGAPCSGVSARFRSCSSDTWWDACRCPAASSLAGEFPASDCDVGDDPLHVAGDQVTGGAVGELTVTAKGGLTLECASAVPLELDPVQGRTGGAAIHGARHERVISRAVHLHAAAYLRAIRTVRNGNALRHFEALQLQVRAGLDPLDRTQHQVLPLR